MGSNLSTAPLDHSDHIGCVVLARARARIGWAATSPLDHSDHIGCVVLSRARARIRWAATSPLHHWITLII